MSQLTDVKRHLLEGNRINQESAFNLFGCTARSLTSIISQLRARDIEILRNRITGREYEYYIDLD